jgi:hypothetical protein
MAVAVWPVNLEQAKEVAMTETSNTPQNPPQKIDPSDLFAFLDRHEEYPTSGYWLAEKAKRDQEAPEMIEFLEAIPGQIEDQETIVKHAIKPQETPVDKVLDISGGEAQTPLGGDQELRIQEDVIEGQPQSGENL